MKPLENTAHVGGPQEGLNAQPYAIKRANLVDGILHLVLVRHTYLWLAQHAQLCRHTFIKNLSTVRHLCTV